MTGHLQIPSGMTDTVTVWCEHCHATPVQVPASEYRDDTAYYCGSNCRQWHINDVNCSATFESPQAHRDYEEVKLNIAVARRMAQAIGDNLRREAVRQ